MRVFLDTNVFLDTIIPGRPCEEISKCIVNLGNVDPLRFCVSTLSLANIAYSARKMLSKSEIRVMMDSFLKRWKILELSAFNIYEAVKSDCPDFEDALQISIAESDCDVIVTNNTKDFKGYTTLEVLTPQEFLDKISCPDPA